MELLEGKMAGTPNPTSVSTKQQRIAELARSPPSRASRGNGARLPCHPQPSWREHNAGLGMTASRVFELGISAASRKTSAPHAMLSHHGARSSVVEVRL